VAPLGPRAYATAPKSPFVLLLLLLLLLLSLILLVLLLLPAAAAIVHRLDGLSELALAVDRAGDQQAAAVKQRCALGECSQNPKTPCSSVFQRHRRGYGRPQGGFGSDGGDQLGVGGGGGTAMMG
jgi:hypothetical protein